LWRARAVSFAPARFLDDWDQIAPWTAIRQWPIQAAWFTAVTACDYSSHLRFETVRPCWSRLSTDEDESATFVLWCKSR
jgi:hypothetical protein